MLRICQTVTALVLSLLFIDNCCAGEWTQFRGPTGSGVAASATTPTSFSDETTVWTTPIPGTGWSSPVISGDRAWLTTAETVAASKEQIADRTEGLSFAAGKTTVSELSLRAICVDVRSGDILHNILLRKVDEPDLINPLNSFASPTPAIADGVVVCHFGSYGTWCLDAVTGEEKWSTALVIDHSVGPGSSPVIYRNTVLIVCDGIDAQFVAGLELSSGKQKWKTDRPPMRATNVEFMKAYSTPLIVEVSGQSLAIIPGAQWMCAYDPLTGDEVWRADCGSGFSTTPMAVDAGGLVVCSTGFMKPVLFAIDPSGQGDVTKSHVVWQSNQGGSTMPTAVVAGKRLLALDSKGVLTVINTATGRLEERIRVGGKFSSSPLLTANALYLGSQDGVMSVFDPASLEKISSSSMDGELMATPAVIGNDLIVRTSKSLMRFSSQESSASE